MSKIKLFISHASGDKTIADALLAFIEASVELPEGAIRCTSVAGYGHSIGTSTRDALQRELREAPCMIGLLTSTSVQSQWVLFELGARWGLGMISAPVLHPKFNFDDLPAALHGTNAAKLDNEEGLLQLVDDVVEATGCNRRGSPKVHAAVRKLVALAHALPALPTDASKLAEHQAKEIVDLKKALERVRTSEAPRTVVAGNDPSEPAILVLREFMRHREHDGAVYADTFQKATIASGVSAIAFNVGLDHALQDGILVATGTADDKRFTLGAAGTHIVRQRSSLLHG